MKIIKVYHCDDRIKRSTIGLSDEILIVEFHKNDKLVGIIEYPNKSMYYVKDAAENWITGVMTEETIKRYKSVA